MLNKLAQSFGLDEHPENQKIGMHSSSFCFKPRHSFSHIAFGSSALFRLLRRSKYKPWDLKKVGCSWSCRFSGVALK